MKRSIFILVVLWMVLFGWEMSPVSGQTEFHGADSVFEREGITILWAILKGSTEESSWVSIKIVNSGRNLLQIFSVEAVDPFSKEKEWVVKDKKLEKENLVRSNRIAFRDKTARRILFYRSAEDFEKEKADMVVYYLGVPDTAPEVFSDTEIEDYFKKGLQRLKT